MSVRVRCTKCRKVFFRTVSRTHESQKMGWKPYCSYSCQYQSRLRGKHLSCGNPDCKNTFYRLRKEIQKVRTSYCSRSCAVRMNNRLAPKRVKSWHRCKNASCIEKVPVYRTYCSKKCYSSATAGPSSEQLVKELKRSARVLKRTPSKREMLSIAGMCIRAFGSWNRALLAAGLTPHRSHSERMYKRKNTIALDGHRCDSISEALIDNWLTQNKIRHERNVPYPHTGHKADWGVGEKVFVEYFGLANDSPRYDRSIKEKRELCKKHNIELIELYANDLYPSNNLNAKLGTLRAIV